MLRPLPRPVAGVYFSGPPHCSCSRAASRMRLGQLQSAVLTARPVPAAATPLRRPAPECGSRRPFEVVASNARAGGGWGRQARSAFEQAEDMGRRAAGTANRTFHFTGALTARHVHLHGSRNLGCYGFASVSADTPCIVRWPLPGAMLSRKSAPSSATGRSCQLGSDAPTKNRTSPCVCCCTCFARTPPSHTTHHTATLFICVPLIPLPGSPCRDSAAGQPKNAVSPWGWHRLGGETAGPQAALATPYRDCSAECPQGAVVCWLESPLVDSVEMLWAKQCVSPCLRLQATFAFAWQLAQSCTSRRAVGAAAQGVQQQPPGQVCVDWRLCECLPLDLPSIASSSRAWLPLRQLMPSAGDIACAAYVCQHYAHTAGPGVASRPERVVPGWLPPISSCHGLVQKQDSSLPCVRSGVFGCESLRIASLRQMQPQMHEQEQVCVRLFAHGSTARPSICAEQPAEPEMEPGACRCTRYTRGCCGAPCGFYSC